MEPGRPAAFTLVELLVVIAIICLLLSILTPTLGRAKQLVRGNVCQSNLHQVHMGFAQYFAAGEGSLLVAPTNSGSVHNTFWSWGGTTMDYDYLYMPSTWNKTTNPFTRGINRFMPPESKAWICPSDPPSTRAPWPPLTGIQPAYFGAVGTSYQYNAFLVGPVSIPIAQRNPPYRKSSQIRRADKTWLVNEWPAYDVCWPYARPAWWCDTPLWSFHDPNAAPFNTIGATGNQTVFFDGHVKYIAYSVGIWETWDYTISDR